MTRPAVLSAVSTAFTETGELDLTSTTRLFEHALEGGVDALFVNGTTGEFPSLTASERQSTLRAAVDVAGADRVVAHVGTASPYRAQSLARNAFDLGITTLSILTPYYMPSTLDGVREQVASVLRVAPGARVYLYLFPDRTGVRISPEEAATVIEEFDLYGAKVSIGGTDYVRDLVSSLTGDRAVLSGNDGLLREVLEAGGRGIVSGVSSAVPEPFVSLATAIERNDPDAQTRAAEDVAAVVPVLGPSIAMLKHAQAMLGLIKSPYCRMAIDAPTREQPAHLEHVMQRRRTGVSTVA